MTLRPLVGGGRRPRRLGLARGQPRSEAPGKPPREVWAYLSKDEVRDLRARCPSGMRKVTMTPSGITTSARYSTANSPSRSKSRDPSAVAETGTGDEA